MSISTLLIKQNNDKKMQKPFGNKLQIEPKKVFKLGQLSLGRFKTFFYIRIVFNKKC